MSALASRIANRAKDLLFVAPLDSHWRRALRGKVMCLLYHRVDDPAHVPYLEQFGAPSIPPDELARELRFLQGQGAKFMTLADLRQGEFPDPSQFGVIVSFDDGFRDNYTAGLPVLEQLGIRGVMFQSTGMVDAPSLLWEHALYWLWSDPRSRERLERLVRSRLADMTASQGPALLTRLRDELPMTQLEAILAELTAGDASAAALVEQARRLYPRASDVTQAHRHGHELASHGHHHYPRRSIDGATFEAELVRSIDVLTRLTGTAPGAFSYPFNSYLPGDAALCAQHFKQVATVDRALIDRSSDPHALARFTWPGPHRNGLRRRRWLLTGRI
ncbi:polysaccharide deacetylase family protein [Caenimonas koreensis DSM 17982]|uniref:Polysaccharide deacetylase family protein n=1 Tax=Caenimonas koreensis DSM 17982 TaxID=1121255 RepID=A0A844B8I8_9BURK|nr:polysaccharide deacetylase family protein [Caenimonas koreensis]MRD46841.1 polysaccharide deacetylase family protein [Caenimonas koreensis DSM 17982]